MKPELQIAFAGARIDRADHIRADPDRLAEMLRPTARVLSLDGYMPGVEDSGELVWTTLADVDPESELVFLGLLDERPCFAPVAPGLAQRRAPSMMAIWTLMGQLDAENLALYGGAKMLVDWHARHRFCARCGSATELRKGGWQRNCTSADCAAEHFPRVDPVTIMLVENDGDVLLGRQPQFPAGNYSALAGFVEPGETIEEAVRREVKEEAGITARDVTYVASQPWPFPSSLMIGCLAHSDERELTVDKTELEDARWFTRREVAAALAGEGGDSLRVPPSRAIAHQLLRHWVARGATAN